MSAPASTAPDAPVTAASLDGAAIASAARSPTARRRELLVASGVTLLVLVPFLGKPFHIDDPLFLWTAERIRQHPADFYGFALNWYGFAQDMAEVTKNPPGLSFFLALTSLFVGLSEWAVHGVLLLPAVGLVCGTYLVAERFTRRPLLAALVSVATPAWLVSATTAMCDTSMLCLWVWAVYFWLRGLDQQRFGLLLAAGACIAAAALTKYFAIALVPLLGLVALVRRRQGYECVLALLLPVFALVLFDIYTTFKYHRGLVRDTLPYVSMFQETREVDRGTQLLLGLSFLGGTVATFLCFWPRIFRWQGGLLLVGVGTILVALCIREGDFCGLLINTENGRDWGALLHVIAFLLAAVQAAALVVLELRRRHDEASLLLVAWILGTWVFSTFLNWSVNVRTMLPLVPPLAILLARRIDEATAASAGSARWQAWLRRAWPDAVPAALAMALSLLVAWGDYQYAQAQSELARVALELTEDTKGHVYFQGHWGFQYYIERGGAIALKRDSEFVFPRDVMVVPLNNINVVLFPERLVKLRDHERVPVASPTITTSGELGAGFYFGHRGSPFAYRFVRAPDEEMVVYSFLVSVEL
ncbi:MAG: glycosyltransferase family 39 protein [Pirellulales bacterium]|nr:glycosyltransferase family 39 protein [Pirellulales bacterium]